MNKTEIENAVLDGKKVHWMNSGYTVIPSGLNDGNFLIGWNIGQSHENYVGLDWDFYKTEDFFLE